MSIRGNMEEPDTALPIGRSGWPKSTAESDAFLQIKTLLEVHCLSTVSTMIVQIMYLQYLQSLCRAIFSQGTSGHAPSSQTPSSPLVCLATCW